MARSTRRDWFSSTRKLLGNSSSKRRMVRRSSPLARLLRIEPLEDRRLLSITVNTLVDEADGSIVDGDISLRDAINASPAGGTINFSVTGTIHLNLGAINVRDQIIQGPGAAQLTIDAHGASNVFNTQGSTTLSGLTITGGSAFKGGGIFNNPAVESDCHLTVANCVISGNTASLGGGIYSGGDTSFSTIVTIANSVISGNHANGSPGFVGNGGGIGSYWAAVTITDSTISGNQAANSGGGVYAPFVMNGSTVVGNSSSFDSTGGGVFARYLGVISNSTITGNTTSGVAGAFVTIKNSTITNNRVGIYLGHDTLDNSIVVGNNTDVFGSLDVASSKNNMIGGSAGGLTNGVNGNIVGVIDSGLGPLADNGGPTQTQRLFSWSPAINAGDNSLIPVDWFTNVTITTDQKGSPRISNGTVDMGAYESVGFVAPSTVVNTATDDVGANSLTSLREAIAFARTLGTPVTFDPTVFATPQTILLTHGEIKVVGSSTPLVIAGPGANLATVNGGGSEIFHTYGTTKISGLTITGAGSNTSDPNPGAIHNELGGTLTVDNCVISNNNLSGIRNQGTVTVTNSIISGNQAKTGGGIYSSVGDNDPVVTTISNTIIENNKALIGGSHSGGGGIYANGTLTISNSTISGNNTDQDGGGMVAGGKAYITNTYIHNNSAGGGGGIAAKNGKGVQISNSTISNNKADSRGGGISGSTVTLTNSTISGNSAALGGGLLPGGTTSIQNSTIANNSANTAGGGLYQDSVGTITIGNSIIVGNTVNGQPNDDAANIHFDAGSKYNLIGDAATAGGLVNGVNGNVVGVNPALVIGPLTMFGGSTPVHDLPIGSPALDAGDPAAVAGVGNTPLYEQRGVGYPRVIGNRIDMGAFERQNPELVGDYNRSGKVDAADYVFWRNTLGTSAFAPFAGADGNGDGTIANNDFRVWQAHFGDVKPGAGSGASQQFAVASAETVMTATTTARDENEFVSSPSPSSVAKSDAGFGLATIAGLVDSPEFGTGHDKAITANSSDTPRRDDALLAWLAAATPVDSPVDGQFVLHGKDGDARPRDGAESLSVDVVFAGLGDARMDDF